MARVGRNRNKNLRMPVGWAPSPSGVIYFRPTNQADRAIVRAITGGRLSLRLGATHDEAAAAGLRPGEYDVFLRVPLGPGMPWRAHFTKIAVNSENSQTPRAP